MIAPPQFDPPIKWRPKALVVTDMAMACNPQHKGETIDLSIGIGANVVRLTEHPDRRQVNLKIELLRSATITAWPYAGHVNAMCEVELDGSSYSADDLDKSAAWGALSLLVGYVRGHIDQMTAVGPFSRVLLSPIVVADIIKTAVVLEFGGGPSRPLYPEDSGDKLEKALT